jgi:hypothetical protein
MATMIQNILERVINSYWIIQICSEWIEATATIGFIGTLVAEF